MITRLQAVRVQEVILNDETNPDRYKALGGPDAVGTILYSKFRKSLPRYGSTSKLSFAKPLQIKNSSGTVLLAGYIISTDSDRGTI